jgi:flagellar biosynthetic protein FliP
VKRALPCVIAGPGAPAGAWRAQASIPLMSVQPTGAGGSSYSMSVQILLLMTLLTLMPAALITMTSFTRILIVLAILRQALGTAQTPSNQIILGLALFLSLFIMAPVFEVAWSSALQPYMNETIGFEQALEAAKQPFREFMFGQTRGKRPDAVRGAGRLRRLCFPRRRADGGAPALVPDQ